MTLAENQGPARILPEFAEMDSPVIEVPVVPDPVIEDPVVEVEVIEVQVIEVPVIPDPVIPVQAIPRGAGTTSLRPLCPSGGPGPTCGLLGSLAASLRVAVAEG